MDFYLNQVLHAFATMDAQSLGELLDPDLTYEMVSLPVFVGKLEEIFKEFRREGDERMEVETANCCGLSCHPDCIRTAYRFVGNNTRNYLDLRFIIEPTADGKDHFITDIFECHELNCHQPKDWYGIHVLLIFSDDEMPGFYLNPDEVIHTEIAMKAKREILEVQEVFHLDEVQLWMEKYRSTFDFIDLRTAEMPDRNLRWDSFCHLYTGFEGYLSFFQKWEKSMVVEAWRHNLELPEEVMIEVILDAEKILSDEAHEYLLSLLNEKEGFRIFFWLKTFVGGLADTFSNSWSWFSARQENMVRKYYALTNHETTQFSESWEYVNPEEKLEFLSFHLDVREKCKKRGEEIPFGLWESRE